MAILVLVVAMIVFISVPQQRIVQQRVLPALSSEFRNNKMIPFVLPLVLLIAEDCTLQEYCTLIMPVITPALHIQNPVQVQYVHLHLHTLCIHNTYMYMYVYLHVVHMPIHK